MKENIQSYEESRMPFEAYAILRNSVYFLSFLLFIFFNPPNGSCF
jgi:hypothetical protein